MPPLLFQLEASLSCLLVTTFMVLLTILAFTRLTPYNDWQEISQGNLAAAMSLGGKIFGVANIMRFAITTNSHALDVIFWGAIGLILQILVYLAFEWVTPRLDVSKEIGRGNNAVGFMSLAFSVAFSYLIGASIS